MFEKPGTPTFLGLSADEWHAVGDGIPDGFQAATFAPWNVPADITKPRYYKACNLAGRLLKIVVYAVVFKVLGIASGGFI